jgi:hypothetical protein
MKAAICTFQYYTRICRDLYPHGQEKLAENWDGFPFTFLFAKINLAALLGSVSHFESWNTLGRVSCCKIAAEWKHQNRASPVSLNVNSASDQFIRLINACLLSLSRSPAGIASRAESARRGQQQKTPPPRPAALCGARQIFALAYYLMPTGYIPASPSRRRRFGSRGMQPPCHALQRKGVV